MPPSILLKFSWLGHRSRWMSHPSIKLVGCLQFPSEVGGQVGNSLVMGTRSLWATLIKGLWHILKVGGWGANFIGLPLRATPRVTPHLCFRCWVQVTGHEAVSQLIWGVQKVWDDLVRWWYQSPYIGPGTLGNYPPIEVPGSSEELVAAPVMMATSGSGTPAAQSKVDFSVMASRQVQMAARIWTSLLCLHYLLILEGGLSYSEKVKSEERPH